MGWEGLFGQLISSSLSECKFRFRRIGRSEHKEGLRLISVVVTETPSLEVSYKVPALTTRYPRGRCKFRSLEQPVFYFIVR